MVTLIGQVPQVVMLLLTFAICGTSMTTQEPAPSQTMFVLMAISLQFFSWHDLMDGLRARRQKSGSPLGRVIDEALDMVQQTCYSMWIGYLFRFENFFFEMLLVMTNIVFHSMEMKYILCRNLSLQVGEIGPVEMELILALLTFGIGGCLGAECMQANMGDVLGLTNETLAAIQVKQIGGCLFLPL